MHLYFIPTSGITFEAMLPYLIIGQGLAGTMLAHHLLKSGKKVMVLDQVGLTMSSRVAAGLYNPVTGKRVVKTWLAEELFPYALSTYHELEKSLKQSFVQDRNVYKPYRDIAEQNDVMAKSSDKVYAPYLNVDFEGEKYNTLLENEFGGVEVLQSGNVEVTILLDAFREKLRAENALLDEVFDDAKLTLVGGKVTYDSKDYESIIFCQGADALKNNYFNWLPFSPTKGEILEVEIDDFPNSHIISKGFFVLPKKENRFVVGSTYELKIDGGTTEKGLNQLKAKLDGLLNVPYEIIKHRFGIRPTVRDRRPFIGKHPELNGVFIFNGFGTKGVTLSPFFAKEFVDFLINKKPIHKEANIERYYSLY